MNTLAAIGFASFAIITLVMLVSVLLYMIYLSKREETGKKDKKRNNK